jgi:hypothetical protein
MERERAREAPRQDPSLAAIADSLERIRWAVSGTIGHFRTLTERKLDQMEADIERHLAKSTPTPQ